MRILANLQVQLAKGQTQFTKAELKKMYMQKVEPFETSDEEVMLNRLKFRNYIRELILNQQRVMEKIAKSEGGQEALQELVQKLQSGELPESNDSNDAVTETTSATE